MLRCGASCAHSGSDTRGARNRACQRAVTSGEREGDSGAVGLVALEDVLERLIGDVRGADVAGAPTAAQPGAGAGGR